MKLVKIRGNEVQVLDHLGRVIVRSIAASPLQAIQQLLKALTKPPAQGEARE